MTNIMAHEGQMHSTIKYFLKRLDQEFMGDNQGKVCAMDNWVQYCE